MKLLGFIYFCCFLVCVLSQSTDVPVVIGSREPVKGVVGQDVILPCHLEPPVYVKNLTVEWKYNKEFVHVYRSQKDDSSSQHQQFKGRTSLFYDELVHGNISLKLTNVTENDSGDYTCYVRKLHSQVKKVNLSLEVVQEGTDNRSSNETFKGDDKGPMIGGIIGGVLVVGLLILGGVLIWKWREVRACFSTQEGPQRDSNANATQDTRPAAMPLMDNPRGDTGIRHRDHPHQPSQPTDNPQELNELEHLNDSGEDESTT